MFHAWTKYIDVRYNKFWEIINEGPARLLKIHTNDNAVDMLTKPITSEKFKCCLDFIGATLCKGDIAAPGGDVVMPIWCEGLSLVEDVFMLIQEYEVYFFTKVEN